MSNPIVMDHLVFLDILLSSGDSMGFYFCILCIFRFLTTGEQILFACLGGRRLLCVYERDLVRGAEWAFLVGLRCRRGALVGNPVGQKYGSNKMEQTNIAQQSHTISQNRMRSKCYISNA